MLDVQLASNVNVAHNYLIAGVKSERLGNAHPNIVPYQLFEAADRPFILAAGNDRLFARTCEVVGRPDLARDARFATAVAARRGEHLALAAAVSTARTGTTTIAAAARRSAGAAVFTGARFADGERAAHEQLAVELLDGLFGDGAFGEFHERKAAGPAGSTSGSAPVGTSPSSTPRGCRSNGPASGCGNWPRRSTSTGRASSHAHRSCWAFTRASPPTRRSRRTRRSTSGAKLGMPVILSASPSVSVSPTRSVPWFGMPRMSPATASSPSSRSAAKKKIGFWMAKVLPVRTWLSFMPRLNLPEQMRKNATRSRWFGSMLACTLNTKPATFGSDGRISRGSAGCGRGSGAQRPIADSSSGTATPFSAAYVSLAFDTGGQPAIAYEEGPFPVRVKVTISDDEFVCDFTGSASQTMGPINCAYTGLVSAVRIIFKALTDPHLPANEGTFRALRVICPEGTVFTAQRPARRGEQVERMLAAFHLNLTALSWIALVVGLFLVYNTVTISVIARREEIGTLRALGTTRRQVLWLFLGEALAPVMPGDDRAAKAVWRLKRLLSFLADEAQPPVARQLTVDVDAHGLHRACGGMNSLLARAGRYRRQNAVHKVLRSLQRTRLSPLHDLFGDRFSPALVAQRPDHVFELGRAQAVQNRACRLAARTVHPHVERTFFSKREPARGIVDLRADSPSYRQWDAVELTQDNRRMLYMPAGIAHGYLTLTDDVEAYYHASTPWEPAAESGVRWNDPALAIKWPFEPVVISDRTGGRDMEWVVIVQEPMGK